MSNTYEDTNISNCFQKDIFATDK